ncbi:C40 family peptidase [uncultured Corynebacterium sp.]|uniref:C40 family peptidase n=1 Tax=uncultured Corynebacterium sp. TaxID=159447 RepID=UPI0025FE31BC|nr:C40 family peptidase [uncultured Corynebacterium sp.]
MIPGLTEIPAMLASAVPTIDAPVPSAPAPPKVDDWFGAADRVAGGWTGEAGSAAAANLARAATSAATVDGHASGIDAAAAEGLSAIAAAGVDLAMLAAEFVTSCATAAAGSFGAGPAGPLLAMAGMRGTAVSTMTTAGERLARLDAELAGPTATLESVRTADVDVPAPPTVPGADGAMTPAASAPTGRAGTVDARRRGIAPASVGGGDDSGADPATGSAVTGSGDGAPTPQARAAVDAALSAVGTPYQWGGNTPGVGLDCSGLTQWAYGQAGVEIPRTAAEQTVGRQVSGDELLPGDLVVWDGHVAMVIGDGQMVEAGDPVQVNPIRTTNIGMPFQGYWRPTG